VSAYLYAIVDGLPPGWRPPTGVDGGAVATRLLDGLAVVAGAVDRVPEATPKTAALHHDVVASALDAAALLPLRYGVAVPDGELAGWVAAQAGLLRASLDRVRNRVEMSVKLLRLGGAPGRRPARGAAPPLEERELRALAEHLVERAGLAEWRWRPSGTGNVAASVAFLVERGDLGDFLARIAPVATRASGVAVVPTGPWPAYSFAPPLERRPLVAADPPDLTDRRQAG